MSTLDEVMNSKAVTEWTDQDVTTLIEMYRANRGAKPKKETGPSEIVDISDDMADFFKEEKPAATPIPFRRRRLVQP